MADPTVQICQMLFDQGPVCHWALDRDARFVLVSGDSQPVFGHPAGALVGGDFPASLPEQSAAQWHGRVARAFAGESFVLRESVAGRIFSLSLFPLRNGAGEILYAGGTAQDISPLNLAEQALRSTVLKVMHTQDAERARLARFLHDEVGQCLSGCGLQLDLLRMDMEAQVPAIAPRTAEIQQLLERVMERVREFSYELNPSIVERAGLHPALDRMAGRLRREFAGQVRFMDDSTVRVPVEVGAAFYKIAQEAVENTLQHAEATAIEIQLKPSRGAIVLEIRDNGKGFEASGLGGSYRGLGLLVMEYVAGQSGVRISISSEPGKGTLVRAAWQPHN